MKRWLIPLLNFLLVQTLANCQRRPTASSKKDDAAKSTSQQGKQPNIVFVLLDDLGYNDVGWHNSWIRTPHLDELAATGVRLENYYIQPICTPTRSQLLSGRYQIHTGLQHYIITWAQPNALPVHDTPTIADVLKASGYSTHMVGKWHVGFYQPQYMPTNRGFDSHFGFLVGSEDHYNRTTCWKYCGLDFRNDLDPERGYQGEYSTTIYTDKAVEVINSHETSKPLFLYLAYQAPHAPLEVPDSYRDQYPDIGDDNRRVFAGMVTCIDEGVRNVTSALKRAGMWDNTIVIFSSDNGGLMTLGGNNWPLRGGKLTWWEGGLRSAGFVHSPLLSPHVRGTVTRELMHVTDWFPTMQRLASSSLSISGLDGFDQWDTISQGKPSPRREILHNIDPLSPPRGARLHNDSFDNRILAAIRIGDYKLITGNPGNGSWVAPPESGWPSQSDKEPSDKNVWLFNVRTDQSEQHDLSDQQPGLVRSMLDRLNYYNSTAVPCRYPPDDPHSNPRLHGGFWGPWQPDSNTP